MKQPYGVASTGAQRKIITTEQLGEDWTGIKCELDGGEGKVVAHVTQILCECRN